MKKTQTLLPFLFAALLIWMSACKTDDGEILANEIELVGDAELTVVEKDTTITVSYAFAIPAREAGTATIRAVATDLAHGTNYTTTPAEDNGEIVVSFAAGAATASFDIDVIDDDLNLPDGSVVFTLASVDGESSELGSSVSLTLTIQNDEGEIITPESEEATDLGEVLPASETNVVEVSFTTLNIISDITASASDGFVVGSAEDGTFGATATLALDATSFFVKAAPDAGAAEGVLTGTVTLTAGDAEVDFEVTAVVSSYVGVLFWVEDFDFPVNDEYPSYAANEAANGFSGAMVPSDLTYRYGGVYNGTDPSVAVQRGIESDLMERWMTQHRATGVAMTDASLTFTGYPGSGVGRAARIAKDGSQQRQRNDCTAESKNAAHLRRLVPNGSEITEGNVYFSAMVKVNEVFSDEGQVLKNAILMLTGEGAYVNNNAMKLNVQDDGAGGFNFGVSKSGDDGSVVYGPTSYVLGTTYVVVFKLEIKPDAEGADPNDVVSVYVFEEGESIPSFEDSALTPEAVIDETNQDLNDVHDVTTGIEAFFFREVADEWAARNDGGVAVQDVEFDGIRVATSWNALFRDASQAEVSNSLENLQTVRTGRCADWFGGDTWNTDN